MPRPTGRVNRGPAAAAGNRRAILAAARRLFAAHGYNVPLHTIAQEAGTGQGTLYRHFPTRLDLALAVFETHFAELTAIAQDADERADESRDPRLRGADERGRGPGPLAVPAERERAGVRGDDGVDGEQEP